MKKYIGTIILSLVVGVYLGKFILNQYSNLTITPTSNTNELLFFIEEGIYNDIETMKNNMISFPYYIYEETSDGIHTYIGITKNEQNAQKVKEYYSKMGYDINIREYGGFTDPFISVVDQYDILLENAKEEAISDICGQILSSYEELVLNGT